MQARQYFNIDSARWSRIQVQAQSSVGMPIQGDSGAAEKLGFKIEWSYDANSKTLTITPRSKPFFMSDDAVYQHLDGLIYATP